MYSYFYRQALSTVAVCFAFRLYNVRNAFKLTLRCFHSCTRIADFYKDSEPIKRTICNKTKRCILSACCELLIYRYKK